MSAEESRRRQLGRGLSALFGAEEADYAELERERAGATVAVEFLRPGRFQPRHRFDEEEIKGLVDSVRENGILQPILVRRAADSAERYEIIAGERRWRAAQLAKLHEVPVIVKDLSDGDALEIALVENLQRQDLTPLEEAEGYQRLMAEFSHTQESLGRGLGKSRSHIANTIRLLGLPDSVKAMIEDGRLSAGHARALLGAQDPEALARRVVARGLIVRQAEALVQAEKAPPRRAAAKDADTAALERQLAERLGLTVAINHRGAGGTLTIRYRTLEQLDDVVHRLSHAAEAPDRGEGEGEPQF
ncbi:MAG: ParB/RepB/Spo0J family partition protein [Planctomycetota bacterium]